MPCQPPAQPKPLGMWCRLTTSPTEIIFLAELLVHTLEKMDLKMPHPSFDLKLAKLD